MGFYDVDDLRDKKDVGSQLGTKWSLSTYKPGFGLDALRDDDVERLWQSDGTQPHLVNIQFARRTALTHVSIFLNHERDDSYTPTKILVRAGTHYHDLVDVRLRTFDKPDGWRHFLLSKTDTKNDEEESEDELPHEAPDAEGSTESTKKPRARKVREPIYAYLLQVAILANHLNGKDTHVRGLKVWGPASRPAPEVPKRVRPAALLALLDDEDVLDMGEGEQQVAGDATAISRRMQLLSSIK